MNKELNFWQTNCRTDLFLTEERVARVRFLWGRRGAGEGAGGGAGGEVRGRRPPAAAAPAASSTTIHSLAITIPCARDARDTLQNILSRSGDSACSAEAQATFTSRAAARPTLMKVGFH